ncbi:methyl-accepting chemotaxis protein [Fodinisporobacter ferrooxydans]|uniref:Methyl-accepting chemotaxis protein n=1 Tax=Fodinisporobacter ferrooxydans TaxID=2901836 RepID=A0ABY4CEJ6_9BACL|nr:methyl-accepting chemotaxis protein [Alicyclobacillaceae bacterium MYW30-H2]
MRKKLIVLLAFFSILPILFISIYSFSVNNRQIQTDANQISMDNVKAVQSEIDAWINQDFDLLHVLAQNPDIYNYPKDHNNSKNIKTLLVSIAKVHSELEVIAYENLDGKQLFRSDLNKFVNLKDRAYFQQVLKTGKPAVSDIIHAKATGHAAIVLAQPVFDSNNKINGIVTATLDLSSLNQFVKQFSKNQNIAYIVGRDGKILAHPDSSMSGKDLSKTSYIQQALKGTSGTDVIVDNGIKMMIAFTSDPLTGWIICNEKPYSVVMAQNTALERNSFLVVIVTLLLAIGLGYYFSNRITKPIRKLVEILKEVADGNLTLQVAIHNRDEIGQLAQSFNQMTHNLRELIQQVRISAEQVAASSEELLASSEQSTQASEQIASSIQEVALGSGQQASDMEKAAQTVNEMASGVQQIAVSSQTVSTSSIQASEASKKGNEAIRKSLDQMNHIHVTVKDVAKSIKELGDHAQNIGKIVEAITGIASQTNLLALNAAIEAARAGEHGRGFAVVADEVRKLAEESSKSAKQIADYIATIQEGIHQAVQSMEVGTKEVDQGIEVVDLAKQSFEKIEQSIEEVSQQIKETSAATEQLSASTEEIVRVMDQIAGIAESSVGTTQNVSAATEEQLASMEEISASASSLAKMAEGLQELISKFKV